MLMTTVVFAAGCTKNDEPNNGGTNGGGDETLSVTTNDVTEITASSATCGGNVIVNEEVTVTARGVCYGTSQNPTIENAHTSDGQGIGSFTSKLTGLTANTKYYVRAYALRDSGITYGEQKNFTTNEQPQTPTLIVSTNNISEITASSATCGGNVTADEEIIVTARGVCYATSQNPTIENAHTSDGQGVGSFTSNLTELSASTKYYVRAYAQNGSDVTYGEEKSFITNEQPQAPTVTVTLINVTPTYLELKFEPSNNTSYYCYNIGGTLTSSGHVTGVITKKFTNQNSQYLQPDTEYEFSVVAYDANGIAGETIHPKFKTLQAPCANYYRAGDKFYELSYAKLINNTTANAYIRNKEIQLWCKPGCWVRFCTLVNYTDTSNNWSTGIYTTGGNDNSIGCCFCTIYINASSYDLGDGSTFTISKSGNMWTYDLYGNNGYYTAHFVGVPTY